MTNTTGMKAFTNKVSPVEIQVSHQQFYDLSNFECPWSGRSYKYSGKDQILP